MRVQSRPTLLLLTGVLLLFGLAGRARAAAPPPFQPDAAQALGDHVLFSWNDLGMHCMNRSHHYLSVLPPYNTLHAQLIQRGDATHPPAIVSAGATVEYSIPGNTTSVTKTDFWTYAPALFGVTLPPDVGLTGLGLAGSFSPAGAQFIAEGIPLTPFPDASPAVESPYQQALVIARDGLGAELARSRPVIPVSTEMGCVSVGCHSSENSIIQEHESVSGFPAAPVLCAACHADPALGAPGRPDAGYFSFRMHDEHKFLDQQGTGTAVCYKCHPGDQAQCLRGVMAHKWGLVCQDCHGDMADVASTIEHSGRVPWADEPACRTCHTDRFGEPAGQLFRNSAGHGGVGCPVCHGSPHAIFPSMIAPDNENIITLQGHAGVLTDCMVCHAMTPSGAGPHNITVVGVPEEEILGGRPPLAVFPNPTRGACTIRRSGGDPAAAAALVFDAQGRTLRLLHASAAGEGFLEAAWDGCDSGGRPVAPGVYFVRWREAGEQAAAKVLVVR